MSIPFGENGAFERLGRQSPYIQIGVGAGTGFLIGYVFFRASKSIAIAVGGTLLALQLALQSGLIKIAALDAILLDNKQRESYNVRFVPTIASSESIEIMVEQLTKAYDVVAGYRRVYVAMLGGFLLGFGLA